MKIRNILWTLALLATTGASEACDFCNCYLGINPHYKKNTISLRYQYTDYTGTHLSDAELDEMGMKRNDFNEMRTQYELHGQFYPTQTIQLLVTMPFTSTHSHMAGMEQEHVRGFGDGMIMANYQLFNSSGDPNKLQQRVFAGFGIQIPTGNWHQADSIEMDERSHLPGSGSFGYCNGASYLARYKSVGVNANVSTKLSWMNNEGYMSGYRFNANAIFYKEQKIKNISLIPYAGIYFEKGGKDASTTEFMTNTGGSILFMQLGSDVYFKRISFSLSYQHAVQEVMNGNQPSTNYRIITGLGYAFN